jgi:NACalpha-BTF3-like transcription factor
MLEKKKKMFSTFYDMLRSKHVKIVERVRSQPEGYNRYRARNMSNDDVVQALAQMGVGREEAEIALENIEYPDHNLAMDWIDNNSDRLDELLMNRTI